MRSFSFFPRVLSIGCSVVGIIEEDPKSIMNEREENREYKEKKETNYSFVIGSIFSPAPSCTYPWFMGYRVHM